MYPARATWCASDAGRWVPPRPSRNRVRFADFESHRTERMQALTGPWATLVRDIKNKIIGENGFGQFVAWDRSRGREFSCIATILHLIGQKKKVFPGTPQIEKLLTQEDPVPAKFKEAAFQTFKIYKLLNSVSFALKPFQTIE